MYLIILDFFQQGHRQSQKIILISYQEPVSHPWKRKAESFSPTCSNCVPWPHIIRTPNPGLAIFIYTIQHLSSPIDDFMNVSQPSLIASPWAPSLHIGQIQIPFCSLYDIVNLIFTSFDLVKLTWFVSYIHIPFPSSQWSKSEISFFSNPQISSS